jgi:hypothetical protein
MGSSWSGTLPIRTSTVTEHHSHISAQLQAGAEAVGKQVCCASPTSAIVRSEEKNPAPAVDMIDIRVQCAGSLYTASTRSCTIMPGAGRTEVKQRGTSRDCKIAASFCHNQLNSSPTRPTEFQNQCQSSKQQRNTVGRVVL